MDMVFQVGRWIPSMQSCKMRNGESEDVDQEMEVRVHFIGANFFNYFVYAPKGDDSVE